MRSTSIGAAALALLATAYANAADEVFLSGFSNAIRGDGFLAVPVGTVERPASSKRAVQAFEDRLYNKDFFYATDGKRLVDRCLLFSFFPYFFSSVS